MPDFSQLPLLANVALFAFAALVVWRGGTRLVGVVDGISEATNLGQALSGLVLLAGATELPELATTLAASLAGEPTLAVTNLFGGVATQTAMLAIADATLAGGALTYFAPRVVLLLEGSALIVLLAFTAAMVVVRDPLALGPVGLGPLLLCAAYGIAVWLLHRQRGNARWQPVEPVAAEPRADRKARGEARSLRRLWLAFAATSAVILVAGATLAWSAEALAEQTGLGTTFVGASLLAAATSLPELSTTLGAVRIGAHAMAISNIFGSNMLMVALLLPADLANPGGPILRELEGAALLPICTGIAVTAIYVIGLLERGNRTFLRMGYDSLAVLAAWLAGLTGLYFVAVP